MLKCWRNHPRSQHISVLTTCTFMFRQLGTIEPSFFKTTSGMHRRPFEGQHLVFFGSVEPTELAINRDLNVIWWHLYVVWWRVYVSLFGTVLSRIAKAHSIFFCHFLGFGSPLVLKEVSSHCLHTVTTFHEVFRRSKTNHLLQFRFCWR